jgi:hypothetical protein
MPLRRRKDKGDKPPNKGTQNAGGPSESFVIAGIPITVTQEKDQYHVRFSSNAPETQFTEVMNEINFLKPPGMKYRSPERYIERQRLLQGPADEMVGGNPKTAMTYNHWIEICRTLAREAPTRETFDAYKQESHKIARGQATHHQDMLAAQRFETLKQEMLDHHSRIIAVLERHDIMLSAEQRGELLEALAEAEQEKRKKGRQL